MSDEKNPKEASNIFHSIMKASVSKKATVTAEKICLYCELPMKLTEPPLKNGKVTVSKYECPNGHTVDVSEKE
ncbi:hypothetical protein HDF24_11750 [Mucilaginibacter sp. X4EP1]|uniref:hypothetical protein n=1 Tax=Mucilaginibacter sp. X4EP1 TaxID=2723092 RepID=UPI002167C236|nr:hypothetical protein [Mucilaginibacter sp. X4EP1]MCS3812932.1 hypothetical protein [Mucilaginibacter sp. X4EP1]